MRIEITHPSAGRVGTQKNVPANQGKILIMLGKAKEVAEKPRRVYKRRDVQPKVVAPVVEEPVTDETPAEETQETAEIAPSPTLDE